MTINVDFKKLEGLVVSGARNAFLEVIKNHEGESFCGFALYSDESAMTICPSVNTLSHLEEQTKEMPDESLYLKFATAEWAYEFEGASHLDEAVALISGENSYYDDESEFDDFRMGVYDCCIAALKKLDAEGLFGTPEQREAIPLVFSVSDFEDPDIELEWIKQLNPPSIVAEFEEYLRAAENDD